jgi:ATP-binding cassette subfamily B protein
MLRAQSEITWPADRLGEALEALGRRCGLGMRSATVEPAPARVAAEGEGLERWIEAAAGWLGLEAEPVEVPYDEVEQFLGKAGPALLRIPGDSGGRFLVLVGGDRRRVRVLTPALAQTHLAVETLREALCREVEAPVEGVVEAMLAGAGVRGQRANQARRAVLRQLLATTRVGGCWLVGSGASAGLATQVRQGGLLRWLVALLGAHTCASGLWVLSWWLLGWMTLEGRLDRGWFAAWLLVLGTLVPFQLLASWAGGQLALRAGALLRRRLLLGALHLQPDEIRHLGTGHLLGRVLESEAIESVAVTGGLLGLTAVVELVLAGFVLGAGAGSWGHVALLVGLVAATAWLVLGYYRYRSRWTEDRLAITNDLVERMIGHRTRLAQEARGHWNEGEDQALERYLDVSRQLDGRVIVLYLVARGWLIVGLVGCALAFIAGDRTSTALAVAVGGVVLAARALAKLVEGLDNLLGAAIGWSRLQLFWQATKRREPVGAPGLAILGPATEQPCRNGSPLLDARDLAFHYGDRPQPVFQGAGVQIWPGDRLLLEGPSGSGKSTLAAVLAGCRLPSSGLLLLGGLDRETIGAAGWRRRVVLAPSFHENHVLTETFAFNLLMGRRWPPGPADLEEAERVCRALDLGPLLERMPAGLQQLVGETGWQLSHGEKSRLYIARAVLQGADLVILDESFAALDPQTLRSTLSCVLERVGTVLVIAHP